MTAPIATLEDLRGRRALVLGLARSGTAVARLLADAGAEVSAYDRRPPAELAEAVHALGDRPVQLALGVRAEDARALVDACRPAGHQPEHLAHLPDHRRVAARRAARGGRARASRS